jgi:hypothetical protein
LKVLHFSLTFLYRHIWSTKCILKSNVSKILLALIPHERSYSQVESICRCQVRFVVGLSRIRIETTGPTHLTSFFVRHLTADMIPELAYSSYSSAFSTNGKAQTTNFQNYKDTSSVFIVTKHRLQYVQNSI